MTAIKIRSFHDIQATAVKRKGGLNKIKATLPEVKTAKQLAKVSDGDALRAMTRTVFQAGFRWSVIDKKWPGFEQVFMQFDVHDLLYSDPENWEKMCADARIVRNGQKIFATRDNAQFIFRLAQEYGSFGGFLAQWPADDFVGLFLFLKKQGARLGGATGQRCLRILGFDAPIFSPDVVAALIGNGIDVKPAMTSQRDMKLAQSAFVQWQQESGLPMAHISKILSYTSGENYPIDFILEEENKHHKS